MSCIVADSGPLIALARLGRLDIPQRLWNVALIPATVLQECTSDAGKAGAQLIQDAVAAGLFEVVPDSTPGGELANMRLDPGERAAIVLALERQAVLLIDEARGRKTASALGVAHTGVCGLLVLAKHRGLIERVAPMLNTLQTCNYFIASGLRQDTLRLAGEI